MRAKIRRNTRAAIFPIHNLAGVPSNALLQRQGRSPTTRENEALVGGAQVWTQ